MVKLIDIVVKLMICINWGFLFFGWAIRGF